MVHAEQRRPAQGHTGWAAPLVLALGTGLFGAAMAGRHVVDPWWSNTAVAALVIVACALLSRGELAELLTPSLRGVVVAVLVGATMVALTHLAFRITAGLWPALQQRVSLLYADIARTDLGAASKACLTLVVVAGEELLWRGVAVDLCQRRFKPLAAMVFSVLLYAVPQAIGASPILVAAAVLAGGVFTLQRLWTKRLVDPLISHGIWSVAVFNLLPLT